MTAVGLAMVALGVWLAWPLSSRRRLVVSKPNSGSRAPTFAAVIAGIGVAVVIGGLGGAVLGLVVAVVVRQGLQRVGAGDRAGREALAKQAPDAVDCLASCLAAGAPLWSAMRVVADAFGQPLSGMWVRAADRHALGSAPVEAFAEWLADPLLAPAGRLLVRSSESGGALTTSLVACAQRLREERAEALEVRARAVGVKAVAPLGVCFLPAFVLLAVVPIVGSLVSELL